MLTAIVKNGFKFLFLFPLFAVVFSCTRIDLFEKNQAIPAQSWDSRFTPVFRFTITDTSVPYQIFITLRHTDQYNFNNIWVNLYIKAPGDSVHKAEYELPLANNEKGWLGTSMDDVYEHRIALTPPYENFYFHRAGEYQFKIEHIMRENPLTHVLNVGLRVEKKVHQ